MSNTNMETPPSSPPQKANPMDPPDLAASMSLSPIEPTHPQGADRKKRGHVRMATPSTPIPTDTYTSGLPPKSSVAYSTPGRSGASSTSNGGPHTIQQERHPHLLLSDLTPVISNSNATYVDTLPSNQGARPGMPGLLTSVVSPAGNNANAMSGLGNGSARFVRSTPAPTNAGGIMRKSMTARMPGNEYDLAARGLRQRRSCMPLPRAELPPAKRSSIEGASNPAISSAAAAGSPGLMRMASNASEDSVRGTEHLRIALSTTLSNTENNTDGLGSLMGGRLAMPSYGSMCSEDESSLDMSNHSSGHAQGMFRERETIGTNYLAPIELKPDRKYFSFQGASQYKRDVRENDEDDGAESRQVRLETIPSPSRRPPATPIREHRLPMPVSAAVPLERNQYQPMLRGQHGVTEMADTKDLDAIFKAPRAQTMPMVVSPYTPAAGSVAVEASPMMVDHQEPRPTLSYPREEAAHGFHNGKTTLPNYHNHVHIPPAYPVESKWSIPSIRLANRVNQLDSNNGNYSYADCSEYTDDDESYYSFLADDDDTASLSSRGSVDPSARRMRISSYHALQKRASQEAVMEAQAQEEANHPPQMITSQQNAGWFNNNTTSSQQPPVIAQSNSFLEKISGISIENTTPATAVNLKTPPAIVVPPPLSRRANTFDYEHPPPILNVNTNNLNVSLNMSGSTMDDADAAAYGQSRRRRNRNRSSRGSRRKEGAAVEWIQGLQNQSNGQLFAESASSKFMTGDGQDGTSGFGQHIGGVGQLNADDVTKALGMPHPLCRSSTIEAGPFTVHRGVFGQSVGRNQDGIGLGSGNNSIALTSSGSGD